MMYQRCVTVYAILNVPSSVRCSLYYVLSVFTNGVGGLKVKCSVTNCELHTEILTPLTCKLKPHMEQNS